MENDNFIQHLDHAYDLVEEEYQKCQAGNGYFRGILALGFHESKFIGGDMDLKIDTYLLYVNY